MIKNIGYEGIKNNDGIRLNGNENGFNPFRDNIKNLALKIGNVEMNRYPDDRYRKLKEAYGKYCGVDKENIIPGNGSDEVINLVISKYINKGDNLVTLDPDFSMYDFYVSINQGIINKFKFPLDDFNIENFIEFAKSKEPKVIIFSNPNNPTGGVIERKDIIRLLDNFTNTMVVVDEAYYEFYGQSVIDLVNDYENLIVTRTLSKAWGMAALRVGFLIANRDLIDELIFNKVPYNINSLSTAISRKLINFPGKMWISTKEIIEQRDILYNQLKSLEGKITGIRFYKSNANFIYGEGSSSENIFSTLREYGIHIRNFDNKAIRITVGTPSENYRLIRVLEDMVIVNEESSAI